MTSALDDLKVIQCILMSGGPAGVAERRIVQQRMDRLASLIKSQDDSGKVATLEADNKTLQEALAEEKQRAADMAEKYTKTQDEIDELKKSLAIERRRVTNLTKKLEKQDDSD